MSRRGDRWRRVVVAAALVVAPWALYAALHADTVTAVFIQPLDVEAERTGDRPDRPGSYRLEVVERSGLRHQQTTCFGRPADAALAWTLARPTPVRDIASLAVVDVSSGRVVLDDVAVEGERFESERYAYRVTIEPTLAAAIAALGEHPIRRLVALSVGAALVLLIFLEVRAVPWS